MRRKRARACPRSPPGCSTLAVLAVVTYFGFTKEIPFKHHYTVQAVFPSANGVRSGSPVRVAGVNVGKVTGDQPRRGRQAGRARDDAHRQEGPAAAQGRDDEDPPAHLPGGQLLRRRQPRLALGAGAARRRSPPDQPDERAGAARPGPQRAAGADAQGPPGAAARAVLGPEGQGRARLQRVDPLLEARLPRQRDRRRRGPGHAARRPRALHRQGRRHRRGDRPQPRAAQVARHRLRHDGGRLRRARAGALGRRRRAAAHAQRGDARAGRPEPLVPGRARPDPGGAAGRALVGAGDRRQHALRQAGARPRVQARAARPRRTTCARWCPR